MHIRYKGYSPITLMHQHFSILELVPVYKAICQLELVIFMLAAKKITKMSNTILFTVVCAAILFNVVNAGILKKCEDCTSGKIELKYPPIYFDGRRFQAYEVSQFTN